MHDPLHLFAGRGQSAFQLEEVARMNEERVAGGAWKLIRIKAMKLVLCVGEPEVVRMRVNFRAASKDKPATLVGMTGKRVTRDLAQQGAQAR